MEAFFVVSVLYFCSIHVLQLRVIVVWKLNKTIGIIELCAVYKKLVVFSYVSYLLDLLQKIQN